MSIPLGEIQTGTGVYQIMKKMSRLSHYLCRQGKQKPGHSIPTDVGRVRPVEAVFRIDAWGHRLR
jgi:hypothetical protein